MGVASASVVVDAYNHERFVEAAVDSALSQDRAGRSLEVVVVDDGSTDGTYERARRREPSVRCVRQRNQGQAAAFNTGLRETTGEVVCFLDGDDLWYPGKLAAVLAEFDAHPEAVWVQAPMEAVDARGRVLRRPRVLPPAEVTLDDVRDGKSVLVGTSGLCVRRSAYERIAPVPPEFTTHADDYLSRHALLFGPGRTVRRVLGGLRVHGGNNFQGLGWSPERLEKYLRTREALDRSFDERLRSAGLSLTPEGRLARLLEMRTKELLLRAWRGDTAGTRAAYEELSRALPPSAFGAFKRLTLRLAAASPRAYLTLQGLYERSSWLPALRSAVARRG